MRRVAWVSVLASAGVLAGCSGPAQPSTTLPTSAAGTTAEPTLEPLGPADFPVPDEAREQTEDGAAAFVRYYVESINRAQIDLDVQYLQQFSSDCDTCDVLIDGLTSIRASGFTVSGGAISVVSLNEPSVSGTEAEFVVSLQQEAVTVVDAQGAVQPDLSATAATFPGSGGTATWVAGTSSWQLTQLTIS